MQHFECRFCASPTLPAIALAGFVLGAPSIVTAQVQPSPKVEAIQPLMSPGGDREDGACLSRNTIVHAKSQTPYPICGTDKLFVIYQAGNSFIYTSIEGTRKRLSLGELANLDNGCSVFFLSKRGADYLVRVDCD